MLREVMAGDLHVFAVRAGASRLTLSLRPRLLEGNEIAELRGADDRTPYAAETAVSRWVEAVKARVRMDMLTGHSPTIGVDDSDEDFLLSRVDRG
jgi:hypothetical protein